MASRTPQKATAHPKQEISITYSHPLLITQDLTVRVLDSNWHQGHEFLMFGLHVDSSVAIMGLLFLVYQVRERNEAAGNNTSGGGLFLRTI